MSFSDFVRHYWQDITAWAVLLDLVVTVGTLCWVLHTKRETMSAIAWSLTVLLVPFLGAFLFFIFGYQSIVRPLDRKKRRRSAYKKLFGETDGKPEADTPDRWDTLAKLGHHGDGFPVTGGNAVDALPRWPPRVRGDARRDPFREASRPH